MAPGMASIIVELPLYVIAKARKDGTFRFLFQVPKRLRPAGWPATIPLPLAEPRTGNPTDLAELERIRADAGRLYDELCGGRAGAVVKAKRRDLATLIELWVADWDNRALGKRTRRVWKVYADTLAAWSAVKPVAGATVDQITPDHIAQLLRLYSDRPTTARHLRGVLSNVCSFGVEKGWLKENPVAKVARRKRKSRTVPIGIWTPEDVALRVDICLERGWIGGAILIQGLWESMGRVSDAPLWHRGKHWDAATRVLQYDTSKSGEESTGVAKMSGRFAELVARTDSLILVTSPRGRPYRMPEDDTTIGDDFREVDLIARARGARKRILRHLRHSAQTHAIACGVTDEQAAVATTHLSPAIARRSYIQKALSIAEVVARKRGFE
jgi:hypothetical protein